MKAPGRFPPKAPHDRVIREGTIGTCPECHSTEDKKYNIFSLKNKKKSLEA